LRGACAGQRVRVDSRPSRRPRASGTSPTPPPAARPTAHGPGAAHVEHRSGRFRLREGTCVRPARDPLHVALPRPEWTQRHAGERSGGLLLPDGRARQLVAPIHAPRGLQTLLLAAPGLDDPGRPRALNVTDAQADNRSVITSAALIAPWAMLWIVLIRTLLVRHQVLPPTCRRCGL